MQVILKSIGCSLKSEVDNNNNDLLPLTKQLSDVFGNDLDIKVIDFKGLPPLELFDRQRKQWISGDILKWLMAKENLHINTKILAICNFDAYSEGLNFVLGEANIKGGVAAIYLPRLEEEFYGRKEDNKIFYERVIKETVHELGHLFGLRHCSDRKCVMYFSNSIEDTDIKGNIFCKNCKYLIKDYINFTS